MVTLKRDSIIRIESIKHNNVFHRSWEENIVLYEDDEVLIGGNNRTVVKERGDKEWRTDSLALFYFFRHHWFNVIIIFEDKHTFYYYCNIASPFTFDNNVLQYIDYDIDVVVQNNGSFTIVDKEEYEVNAAKLQYPQYIKNKIKDQLQLLKEWIHKGKNPFNEECINNWYDIYINKLT